MQDENSEQLVKNKILLALHWFCSFSSPWLDAVTEYTSSGNWEGSVDQYLTGSWYGDGSPLTIPDATMIERVNEWAPYLDRETIQLITNQADGYAAFFAIAPKWCVGPCWRRSPMDLFKATINDIYQSIADIKK